MSTPERDTPNAEQIKHWNEVAGPQWVALHDQITSQIMPLGEIAMARAAVAAGERVLDIGCGCGDTSITLARLVGPTGSVLGVDISAPMLERARETARAEGFENIRFEQADAQIASLPDRAKDLLFSRFGVMFFSDPESAFKNLRGALRSGGRLSFVCWRAVTENPWMMVPAMAAMQVLPFTPPDPDAPGPFAFADSGKVRGILERAGFVEVAFEPIDRELAVGGEGSDIERTVDFLMNMGMVAAAARQAPPEALPKARQAVREVLAQYQRDGSVRMQSASWVVTALSP
ncbi:MAG: methyltransferase domain-containing protein [Polyangiaceae bacterium]|nr:methyltransferase domain-containing protein [Polyangiaceae bacterium]